MKAKKSNLFCRSCCVALFFMLFAGCGEKSPAGSEKERARLLKLAEAGRYEKAASYADRYLASGAFFPGLGLFASSVNEKIGNLDKAVLYAFLDYEFTRPGEEPEDNGHFLASLYKLNDFFTAQNRTEDEKLVVELVRSLFDPSVPYAALPEIDSFVYSYIILRNKIRDKTAGFSDLRAYLALEKYFTRFAPYYWGAWRLISALDSSAVSAAAGCLEKIILLKPDSSYAADARRLLAAYAGAAHE